ncbi:phenazine antibiotic biosynthesis protein [Nocardia sp. NBC_00508]|uniref:phenazine antibiotic biosynthesis protein n=1 Tax=Nocardia sp. NBC_00508 TaxID=2975992 RepID=UPI002E81626E|nr:phenazine antibiotic biosynthesis protein [Nocardia sp. NBC_00508]WUD65876.1 phenazine antibiotic biosynthesis protein [Nocardia sp. NBC_00508]
MSRIAASELDCPPDQAPEPDALIRAAMRWHFGPDTGSPYWLGKVRELDFDPRHDVRTTADLALFPNLIDELRDISVEALIPRGYSGNAEIVAIFESGGTTGPPKRVVCLSDWADRTVVHVSREMDKRGHRRGVNWLALTPTAPHMAGEYMPRLARYRGGTAFTLDMDPRWVKRCLGEGRTDEAERYIDHILSQARVILQTQNVGVLATTPPLLERLCRNHALVKLVREKVQVIQWGGARMDPDTRHLLRTEVFPGIDLMGTYGSTMIAGMVTERAPVASGSACVFDALSPYISFSVVNPGTDTKVDYGERGQVVMNHVSKSLLVPNNPERDTAIRVPPPPGHVGDSLSDVAPMTTFDGRPVIEGVY